MGRSAFTALFRAGLKGVARRPTSESLLTEGLVVGLLHPSERDTTPRNVGPVPKRRSLAIEL